MCGIVGGFSFDKFAKEKTKLALKKIEHRGPDNKDSILLDNGTTFLGHTRLSIIDLDEKSNQPFYSNCQRYVLIFNGEIFNYQDLKKKCDWYTFQTNSDTEVLLAYYIKYREKALELFDGMFGFAVYDKEEKSFFIARDRFGIKQLYFFNDGKQFIFSSEIKPLLVFKDEKRENRRVLKTFIETATYDFGNETFFDGILRLEAGHYLTIKKDELTQKKAKWYFFEDRLKTLKISQEEAQEELEKLFRESIKKHLISDVDIGLNISGGLDSSILAYFVSQEKPDLHTFNQDYDGFSEREWIDENLKTFSFNHHYINLNAQDILDRLTNTVKVQEEPFGGVAVIGYSYLYEKIKDLGIKVILDGNGVDEGFLGYEKYLRNINSAFVDGSSSVNKLNKDFFLATKSITSPSVNFFQGEERVKNLAIKDLLYTKIPRALRFNDRMSMSQGIELRVPFLDHKIIEFGLSLPNTYLINQDTKKVVRDMASKFLKQKVSNSPKRSIQTPQNLWLANEFKDLVENIITSSSFKERGWFDSNQVKREYNNYLNSYKTNSFFIWQWINLELWAREFL